MSAMKHQILDSITGVTGVSAIEAIHQIPDTNYTEVLKLVLQIVVAIGSLWSMISRRVASKKNNDTVVDNTTQDN